MRNRATIPAMNLAVPKPMSLTQFLAWEERQELRYEFDGTRPIAMAGGPRATPPSSEISPSPSPDACAASHVNSTAAISRFRSPKPYPLPGRNGRHAPSRETATRSSTTPSSSSRCLSPSTAANDRIVKAREYQATPSVQRYVMLEQDGVGATVYARAQDGWSVLVLKPGDTLDMPEIGLSIPLAEFYEGLLIRDSPAEDNDNERRRPRPDLSTALLGVHLIQALREALPCAHQLRAFQSFQRQTRFEFRHAVSRHRRRGTHS